jgi:hypothetical protein
MGVTNNTGLANLLRAGARDESMDDDLTSDTQSRTGEPVSTRMDTSQQC